MVNKTIYMTYKKPVPKLVFDRWKEINVEYNIDFSLDSDCITFLHNHFNDYVVNLFKSIPVGMYKADLWRLCKLYVHGGVYADVDLVPYLNIDSLDKDITFYSCLDVTNSSIFQAFIVNFSKPKNPLIFIFLLSYLINNPYAYFNGPTYDMYNCIKYNLNNISPVSERKYNIDSVKIKIHIGRSDKNIKEINLFYFPHDITCDIILSKNPYDDTFDFKIINNLLIVKRTDIDSGWDYNHSLDIVINSKESIYLFKEECLGNSIVSAYVSYNSMKILDSRDANYFYNNGW